MSGDIEVFVLEKCADTSTTRRRKRRVERRSHRIFVGRNRSLLAAATTTAAEGGERGEQFSRGGDSSSGSEEDEARLRQSQKMEAIGTLTGGVAHDFNNLLTAILGNTQLALRDLRADDAAQRRRLNEIERAGRRAADLTRQLLAFSRRQHLERKVISLNDTVCEMTEMIGRIIGEDVEIHVKCADDLPPVFADAGQIEQVVVNLAVNARDAMPEGGTLVIETVGIELEQGEYLPNAFIEPGEYVLIQVSDDGAGMDAETRRRIFEPFFTTKEIGKGTGLGLSTVYGIVKQHGGYINVYSEVGYGTNFKIYLPVHVQSENAKEPTAEKQRQPPLPFRRGTETILFAENEEALRDLAKDVLERNGYTVLAAGDGAEAVRIYREHRGQIDLLLLDVVMPRMGGAEAFEKISALDDADLPPVVFMTGYSSETVQNRFVKQNALFLGADAVIIQKPYTVESLESKIRETLNKQSK